MRLFLKILSAIVCCVVVTIAQWAFVGSEAIAANCGGLNQRACKVFERIPSCNRGLVERGGRCVARPRPPTQPIVCGGLNQRACKVFERVPSCNRGLVERGGRCVARPRPPTQPIVCGGLNQRACKVFERIPSCNRGLVERGGRCVARPRPPTQPIVCGGLNQRACKVFERIPSCNRGLVERGGRCIARPRPPTQPIVCGGLNQRACKVFERVPSCNHGLHEDFVKNLCVQKSNATSLVKLGAACYRDFRPMAPSFLRVAFCFHKPAVLRVIKPLLRKKQSGKLREVLLAGACVPELRAATRTMRSRGFKSFSIGVGGDVGAGVGANSQFFVALDTSLRGRAYVYELLGWQLGTSVGGSLNVIVTAYYAEGSQLAGKGQGFSVSLKALEGAGGAVGLSYAEHGQAPRCTSFSAAAGAGAEANVGSVTRTITLRLTN